MGFSHYSPEVLTIISETNAFLHSVATGSDDDFLNWIAGRKTTALELIEEFIKICESSNGSCPTIPEFCIDYIKELNIQNLKELKAFFVWENSGNVDSNKYEMEKHYFIACDEILFFCRKLSNGNNNKCSFYNDIVRKIDRRKKERRVLSSKSNCTDEKRKGGRRKDKSLDLFFNKV